MIIEKVRFNIVSNKFVKEINVRLQCNDIKEVKLEWGLIRDSRENQTANSRMEMNMLVNNDFGNLFTLLNWNRQMQK